MISLVYLASLVVGSQTKAVLSPSLGAIPFASSNISVVRKTIKGSGFIAVVGGRPSSVLSTGREPVAAFVRQKGAAAGINGTFFAMAAIKSRNNSMVGPVMTEDAGFVPCKEGSNTEKLDARPFILWNHDSMMMVDYRSDSMNESEGARSIMPKATDCFVAGSWLVRDGQVATKASILLHGPRDAMTPRKRAFLGITRDGHFVAGASSGSVSSVQLANAAVEYGCVEAALLDSGFSTSLVVGSRTLASGHQSAAAASRPVPHAIVIYGSIEHDEG